MLFTPSFWRSTRDVVVACLLISFAGYFLQGYFEQKWWTFDYVLGLAIPIALMPILVWFIFVPSRLEVTDKGFDIRFPFRRAQTLPWNKLKYWGKGESVFMLQFDGSATLQIFARAYPREQWSKLVELLSARFPEQKATGWFGARGFIWKRR